MVQFIGALATSAEEYTGRLDLASIYKKLNCSMIQRVVLHDKSVMLMDEEGKFKEDVIVNVMASMIAEHAIFPGDFIAGDILLLSPESAKESEWL